MSDQEQHDPRDTRDTDRDANQNHAMRRNQMRQSVTRGSTLGVGVLLALALLVIVNYFGWKYHARWDWTSERLYTLSEKSENVVGELTRPMEIVVFLTPASQLYEPLRELLARYEAASPLLSVRYADPVKDLLEFQRLADRFELTEPNVVVVALQDAEGGVVDTRVLPESELAEFDFSGFQMGAGPSLDAFKGEQEVTNAILELAEGRRPRVLFTTGHGERSLDDPGPSGLATARQLLERDNLEVEEWASLGQPTVPPGTDLVVVAGPTSPFLPPELEVLDSFLDGGGRLLVMLDPVLEDSVDEGGGLRTTGLAPWLAGRGVEVGSDVVVDPANPVPFYGAETLFVDSFGSHPATRSLAQARVPVVISLARSVGLVEDAEAAATELLTTSPEGWGERDLADLTTEVAQGDGDLAGPVGLAVVVEGAPQEPEGNATEADTAEDAPGDDLAMDDESAEPGGAEPGYRLVVTGDSDFATNQMVTNLGNQVLLTDTFNWLVEQEAALGIPAKDPQQASLSLSQEQLVWIWVYVLLLLPLSAVVLGVWIYFRRRR